MGYKIPDNVAELDNEKLESELTKATDAFKEIAAKDNADITDEEAAQLVALRDFVQGGKAQIAQNVAAAEAREAELNELRTSMDEPDAEEEPAAEGEAPADGAPADVEDENPHIEVEPIVEPTAPVEPELPAGEEIPPAPADEDEKDPKDGEEFAAQNDTKEPEAVTASAKPSIADAKKNAPEEDGSKVNPAFAMVATAGLSNVQAGSEFNDFAEAAGAIVASLRSLPTSGANTKVRHGALSLKAKPNEFTQNSGDDTELLLRASSEARLQEGSLVAAGGWGAPSDISLDFCKLETTDGLLDLPGVTINRGGVKYTKGPDFASVMASSVGFWDMDEATADAGVELKTSLRPDLPGFQEERMDAVGVMVEAGLLLRNGWPELIQRYAELAMIAHAHKMSAKLVRGIQGFTGDGVSLVGGFGNTLDLLHALELVLLSERQKYAMAQKQTFEMLLPVWAKSVFRADLANRTGVDHLTVTDEQINAWFTLRGARVQWLSQYQPLTIDVAAKIALGYPAEIDVIVYPAGAYVKGTTDVISLDTIYDSTNLKKNDYVHLFVEQGVLVTNPCYEGRRFQVPFKANGRTAAANLTTDLAFTVAP